jgi:hypothetical protein
MSSNFAPPLAQGTPVVERTTLPEQYPPATVLLGPDSFEDNLDATHAYTRNIEIPAETLTVLSVKVRMRTKAYRYYVATAASASNSPGHGHTETTQPANTGVASLPIADGHWHGYNDASAQLTGGESIFHTHVITVTPGIVETTTPAQMQVTVDGTIASATATSLDDFDLIPYLTKDAFGVVLRGLHTVMFTPNGVGRVQATISGVLLLQSRGR